MADHIEVNRHLKHLPEHDAQIATFLGQAHIAGTGPDGMTCRECVFWGIQRHNDGEWKIESPGHYAAGNKTHAGLLKKGRCNYEIRGKAARRFPGGAKSCRFFALNSDAPAAIKKVSK